MDGRGLQFVLGTLDCFLQAVVWSVLVRRTCDSIPGDANGKVCGTKDVFFFSFLSNFFL